MAEPPSISVQFAILRKFVISDFQEASLPTLEQTAQGFQYRIVKDSNNPKLWAFERLEHDRYCAPVGGFQTQEKAKRAAKAAGASKKTS